MDQNESEPGQGGREAAFWRVRVNQADSPVFFPVFVLFLCSCLRTLPAGQ